MYFDGSFKTIKKEVNISSLLDKVLSATEEQWNRNQLRQQRFEVAQEVVTILLKLTDHNHNKTKTFEEWYEWKDVINPVLNQIYPIFKNPFLNKCMIANVRPGKQIPEHTDSAQSFTLSHRLHIPLVTNKEAVMTIKGEERNMKVGVCYEVNNKQLHSVVNNGDTDRIHLLFDIYERTDEEQKMAEGVI